MSDRLDEQRKDFDAEERAAEEMIHRRFGTKADSPNQVCVPRNALMADPCVAFHGPSPIHSTTLLCHDHILHADPTVIQPDPHPTGHGRGP